MFGGAEESSDGYGRNRFLEKQDALEEDKQNSMDAEKALQLSKELGAELSRELKNAAAVFADSIVPGFIKRLLNQKVYQKMVIDVEGKQDRDHDNVVATIDEHRVRHKSEMRMRKKLKARNRADSILGTETKKELAEAKVAKQDAMVADYKERRSRQLEQIQFAIDTHVHELRAKMESELVRRRAYNLSHWSEQAALLHEEALVASRTKADQMQAEFRKPIDVAYSDWNDRDLSRTKLQVEGEGISSPIKSTKFGGLFGSNYSSSDLRVPSDLHLFSSRNSYQAYDRAKLELIDTDGEATQMQSLYDALQLDTREHDDGKLFVFVIHHTQLVLFC